MPRGVPKAGHRQCNVCRHGERTLIESLLVTGVPLDKIAARFGVSRDALFRHHHNHISEESKVSFLIGAGRFQQLSEVAAEENSSLLDYLRVLRGILFAAIDRKAQAGDTGAVVALSRAAARVLRDIGAVTGEISTIASTAINVSVNNGVSIVASPQFEALQSGMIEIARRHPDARGDILDLFRNLDNQFAASSAMPRAPTRVIEATPIEAHHAT